MRNVTHALVDGHISIHVLAAVSGVSALDRYREGKMVSVTEENCSKGEGGGLDQNTLYVSMKFLIKRGNKEGGPIYQCAKHSQRP